MRSKKVKTTDKLIKVETVEEALARGVKIEQLPTSDEVTKQKIEAGTIQRRPQKNVKGVPMTALNIRSLGDAMDFYGEKTTRKHKVKKPDFSQIDKEQIPKSLHYILEEQKDVAVETKDKK